MANGSFMEEPGSGAVATIDNKTVSVGTLEWVQRLCAAFPFFMLHVQWLLIKLYVILLCFILGRIWIILVITSSHNPYFHQIPV